MTDCEDTMIFMCAPFFVVGTSRGGEGYRALVWLILPLVRRFSQFFFPSVDESTFIAPTIDCVKELSTRHQRYSKDSASIYPTIANRKAQCT